MHNFSSPHAVAIEVTSLKNLPDNESWIRFVESKAISFGGRPHWGQQNHLSARQTAQMFGANLDRWRNALTALVGGSSTFSTAHTVQRGLEPNNPQAKPTLFGRKVGDIGAAAIMPALELLLLHRS